MTSASDQTLDTEPLYGPRGHVLGRTERLMRVRLYRDPADGVLGARTGSMTTGPWVCDLDGRPLGAATAVLMDNTLATSLHAAEPGIRWMVTTELHLNVLRPLPTDGSLLEAWTRIRVADTVGGMGTGTVLGTDGTEYVQATGWFQAVQQHPPAAVAAFEANAELPLGPDTEVPLGPILGVDGTSVAPTGAERPTPTETFRPGLRFLGKDELRNPHGAVHGGALTTMTALAAQQAMPDRLDFDLQSLRVMFLRPATGPASARTRARHAGRTLRVVEVELVGESGRPFIHAEAVFRGAR